MRSFQHTRKTTRKKKRKTKAKGKLTQNVMRTTMKKKTTKNYLIYTTKPLQSFIKVIYKVGKFA